MEKISVEPSNKQPLAVCEQGKWNQMMTSYSSAIHELLSNECSEDMTLEKFKMKILSGEREISANIKDKIQLAFKPVKDYATIFASLNNINTSDLNEIELAVLGGTFPPSTKINNGELAPVTDVIPDTGSEIWDRIVNAVGLETSAILRALDMETANVKVIAKALSKNLIENTGLMGAALVVADFGTLRTLDSDILSKAV